MHRHRVTVQVVPRRPDRGLEGALARALPRGAVTAADERGTIAVELGAYSSREAESRVRRAVAAAGLRGRIDVLRAQL